MFFNAHTHNNIDTEVAVVNSYPYGSLPQLKAHQLLSCGIHPWHIHMENISESMKVLKSYCDNKTIQAIGECGLDANRSDMSLQKELFWQQIKFAEQYRLPTIIHSVKTHHFIQEIRKSTGFKQPWIVHGFQGPKETARQFQKLNIFISFGERLLDQPQKFKSLINQVDTNFVLFETDESCVDIKRIYSVASEMLAISELELEKKVEINFKRIFGER